MKNLNISIVSLSVSSKEIKFYFKEIEFLIKDAISSKSEFVLFPEYAFAPIINYCKNDVIKASDLLKEELLKLSLIYKINIIWGGLFIEGNYKYNTSYIASNGIFYYQHKLNLIESEKQQGFKTGNKLIILKSWFGNFAIQTCYDIEFPELSRILKNEGVSIIFVPSYTIDKYGDTRVSSCCSARCIENHIFVIKSCLIGYGGNEKECPEGKGLSTLYCPSDKVFEIENGYLIQSSTDKETNIIHGEVPINKLELLKLNMSTNPYNDYLLNKNKTIIKEYVNEIFA